MTPSISSSPQIEESKNDMNDEKNNIPSSMADALQSSNPVEALLALSRSSETRALTLAKELSTSLIVTPPVVSPSPTTSRKSYNRFSRSNKSNNNDSSAKNDPSENGSNHNEKKHFPIPLPPSLSPAPKSLSKLAKKTNSQTLATLHQSHYSIFDTSLACTESIHSSLSKIANFGSRASSDLRALEEERNEIDTEADDIYASLQLRNHAAIMQDSLHGGRWAECARAVASYRNVNATKRALGLAGEHVLDVYNTVETNLTVEILARYELAVDRADLMGLSELTPLLGLLNLSQKGVKFYLEYSGGELEKMIGDADNVDNNVIPERKRGEFPTPVSLEEQNKKKLANVCAKLAKIYNGGVTHLRHHLPMVTSALGEANGDVALIKLVHEKVEEAAVRILKFYSSQKGLSALFKRAERVSGLIMDKYATDGGGHNAGNADDDDGSEEGGAGLLGGGGHSEEEDVFVLHMGSLAELDASMDETALCLQHTESYERFLHHAVAEVMRAYEWREQQAEEERTRKLHQKQQEEDPTNKNLQTPQKSENNTKISILPPHSALDEIAAEIGGHYSGIERCLLLGSMQRAFVKSLHLMDDIMYNLNTTFSGGGATSPTDIANANHIANLLERNYTPIGILQHRSPGSCGWQALQSSLVEECLYAAQRSTLRAFATGHTGTACAAANFCTDALGRVLMEVLIRKTDHSTAILKPGEGLLVGQGGILGQAALAALRNVSKQTKTSTPHNTTEDAIQNEMKQNTNVAVARACASYNDLEIATEYTKKLEMQFLNEIEGSFPPSNAMTEQLHMCVKGLDPIISVFKESSDTAIDSLLTQILPRVRSIVNDAVGQESAATTAFMGATSGVGSVIGGAASGVVGVTSSIKMNYDLTEQDYELSQAGETYMDKMMTNIDQLLDPLRMHLIPRLSDAIVLGAIGAAAKRVEVAIRRTQFTSLGALSLDSDFRSLLNFTKERTDSSQYNSSSIGLQQACTPLARLGQISQLLNVDDLEDVLDLISALRRKGHWDLKMEDVKTFLNLRVEFESRKVNELLHIDEEEEEHD
mmetsp:Transcript_36522/g.53563  ORF Transcript_36522/g.53563 Transcript_36522/m.53563 type:complete len:1051 (-) Transcript_36522:63-3215(-)|eukprot:CAMPEP_0195533990 /NCGR_PEP_ID=MMETSP0794_2-20130614/41579_1 /TAXON_ID=515487 /ORGANISM="Stephanopyxis turris, Strain CCMP 815" /LENGTH=1050 /DNA_ID=CAMNT_0040666701 /DNA_START=10 /DNA_END=3162 /DNA_ORIENTATION=-